MFTNGGALFLDRDGTIVEETGYVTSPEMLRLLPGAAGAIARFNAAGVRVFVVSNQAGIARGLMSERDLETVHLRLVALLGAEGARLDGIYYCPHHPESERAEYAVACGCRKPAPGLLEQAAREHGADLADSVMIGDNLRDLQAGRAAGTKTVLVRTGLGTEVLAGRTSHPDADWVAADLAEAAEMLLR
ncbi:MAG: HAD family hydrolase [Planctomycetes bacterium]|nr:HAD family hydrolase [Planctomycetota bacterium]